MTTNEDSLIFDLKANHVALSANRTSTDTETIYSRAIAEIERLRALVRHIEGGLCQYEERLNKLAAKVKDDRKFLGRGHERY
jgi:hypothetical protein